MARWSKERQSAARESVLSAARDAFEKHGFDGATMRQIADAAGVAVGTLFNYFPDKQALLRDALYADLEGVIATIDFYEADALDDLFVAVARPLVDYYCARPVLSRVLLRDAMFADGPRAAAFIEQAERVGVELTRHVRRLQKSGVVAESAAPEAVVLAFFSYYYFVLMTQLGAGGREVMLRQIRLLGAQLAHGVGGN